MPSMMIKCCEKGCNEEFEFTEREQEFYESKGYTPPKRCKPCREKNKARKEQNGSRGRR